MDQKALFDIIKRYINYLHINKINVSKVYLFGSYAIGNFNEDSDIDLAVIISGLTNSLTMQIELMKLGRKIDTRIEPHPIDESAFNTSNPFAKEILKKGVQIF